MNGETIHHIVLLTLLPFIERLFCMSHIYVNAKCMTEMSSIAYL